MITAARNCSRLSPAPAAADNRNSPIVRRWGASFSRAAARLVEARLQSVWISSPMIGQLRTPCGGGGTWILPSCALAARSSRFSISPADCRLEGPSTTISMTTVTRAAAGMPRPPKSLCSHTKIGCRATARITPQRARVMKGPINDSDQPARRPIKASRTAMSTTTVSKPLGGNGVSLLLLMLSGLSAALTGRSMPGRQPLGPRDGKASTLPESNAAPVSVISSCCSSFTPSWPPSSPM